MTVRCTDRHEWAKRARLMFLAAVSITAALLTGGADAQANGGARFPRSLQDRVVGYFSFGVGRYPVSLGG